MANFEEKIFAMSVYLNETTLEASLRTRQDN